MSPRRSKTAGVNHEIATAHRRTYTRHVQRLGHAFNDHIENAIYRQPLRVGIGMPTATIVYTVFGFFMNAMYARFDPRGPVGMAAFDLLFVGARLWIAAWTAAARISLWFRRTKTTSRNYRGKLGIATILRAWHKCRRSCAAMTANSVPSEKRSHFDTGDVTRARERSRPLARRRRSMYSR